MKLTFILIICVLTCCQTKKYQFEDSTTPPDMVHVPSGTFIMGGKSGQAYKDEFPTHNVSVSAFLMDKTEVTNAQFMDFVKATNYVTLAEKNIDWGDMQAQLPPHIPRPPDSLLFAGSLVFKKTSGPVDLRNYTQWWEWTVGANWRRPEGPGSSIDNRMDHPSVHIAWDDAVAYAKWAGKRLPTEAEWEWAAMGGLENAKYPWGNVSIEDAANLANFWQGSFPYQNQLTDGFENTAPVMSFPPNGYGLYDMAGNVWEWCEDKYDIRQYQKNAASDVLKDPHGAKDYFDPREPFVKKHVIRGGSFLCNDSYCTGYRASRRMSSSRDSGFNHTGFRCVKDIQ